jgi:ABC-type enterochelin transport system substrate-binding protein
MKSLSLFAALLLAMTAVQTQDKHGVISGTVTKIDNAAKTVTIKTKTGTEVVAKETARTVKEGGATAKEDGEAVVHYTTSNAEHTAVAIKPVGNKIKVAEGTVDAVDAGAKTVAVKTKDGTVVVFNSAEDGVVSAGGAMKQGALVTIHYTEDGARKIAHAFSTI